MATVGLAGASPASQPVDRDVSPIVNGKRKRDGDDRHDDRDNDSDSDTGSADRAHEQTSIDETELYSIVDELLLVLKSTCTFFNDILSRPISSPPDQASATKRSKLGPSPTSPDSAASTTSVQVKLDAKAYKTLDDLAADFDLSINSYIDQLKSPHASEESAASPASLSRIARQARELQSDIHELIGSEQRRASRSSPQPMSNGAMVDVKPSPAPQSLALTSSTAPGQYTLTTFGADYKGRGPSRQWFASRKDPISTLGETDPVEHAALPNGVSATSVQSVARPSARKPSRHQTLGEIVRAPSHLLVLRRPQPPASSVPRSQTVEWHKPSSQLPSSRPKNPHSWINAGVPSGVWLSYSSNTDLEDPPAEKRAKGSSVQVGNSENVDQAELDYLRQSNLSRSRAKQSSLFRSTFSSFAPSHDDSNAIVPASIRARFWWDQTGADLYRSYVEPDPEPPSLEEQMQALDPTLLEAEPVVTEDEMKDISAALDSGEHENVDTEPQNSTNSATSAEDLLQDISENIENLINYQHSRMKVISLPGQPTIYKHPSEAEEEIYETLKLQLSCIIALLPPSALSRLDGNKLKRLNINTIIPLQIPPSTGNFELADPSQPPRPNPVPTPMTMSRPNILPNASTPQSQQRAQHASHTFSKPPNRPSIPQQYNMQQQQQQPQARFANPYATPKGQGSPAPNGYQRSASSNYQNPHYSQYVPGGQSGTPSKQPLQYSTRPTPAFQPRPSPYQNPPAGQGAPSQNVTAASRSPQPVPNYGPQQGRGSFSASGGPQPSGQQFAVHRISNSGAPNAQGAQGTIGALVDISPEEQQQINRIAHEKNRQNASQQYNSSPQRPTTVTLKTPDPQTPVTNGITASTITVQSVQQSEVKPKSVDQAPAAVNGV